MKIRLVGTELSHADGRTDRKNVISHFSQFCARAYIKNVHANSNVSHKIIVVTKIHALTITYHINFNTTFTV